MLLSDHAFRMSRQVAGSLIAVRPLAGSSRRRRFIIMDSWRGVYQGLRRRMDFVEVGDWGR